MSVLDDIVAGVRIDMEQRRERVPLAEVERAAVAAAPATDPLPRFRAPELAVIAEVKRRSPSKGDLAPITDPAGLAASYAEGGAAAISVPMSMVPVVSTVTEQMIGTSSPRSARARLDPTIAALAWSRS